MRGVEPSDAEMLYAMEGEGFNEEYGDLLAPLSLEMLRTYAFTYDADPFSAGSVRLIAEEGGSPVGMVDLYDISAIHQRAEVGIYVVRSMRRKGVGRALLEQLERYSLEKLSLIHLSARTIADNEIANRLFLGAGYLHVGQLPGWQKVGGRFRDVNLFLKRMECG